jgi:phosphate transport system permease protein
MTIVATGSDASSLRSASSKRSGDATFKTITMLAGVLVFVLLGAIAVFLVVKAVPALQADKSSFWTTQIWDPDGSVHFGIAALAFGTLLTSFMALVMAVPVALGVSLYVTQYAPRRVATLLGYATDLLAAVPSVVYGLWGIFFLLPHLIGTQVFLSRYFGWIPLFADKNNQVSSYSKSVFGASIVLAIMVLPIIAAISREIFRQVDPAQREAALALGATRWEMIRTAVLPPSWPGVTSAIMLGFGRAIGETIAVALVIGNVYTIDWHTLIPGGQTIAANIAVRFGEAGAIGRSALIASGLVLFVITLVVNLVARYVIYRSGAVERSAV